MGLRPNGNIGILECWKNGFGYAVIQAELDNYHGDIIKMDNILCKTRYSILPFFHHSIIEAYLGSNFLSFI